MLQWFLSTLTTALPFLIPVVVLLCVRIYGYRWKAQKIWTGLALGLYCLSLLLFAVHAVSVSDISNEAASNGMGEWFRAFYGDPFSMTTWCMLGFWAQGLSAVAVLFAVNWRVIRLFYGEDVMASKNVNADVQKFMAERRREREEESANKKF